MDVTAAADASGGAAGDERFLDRLRWRCRRGMLENDLLLARFLDARGATLTLSEVAALDALLDLDDGELWDLIAARAEPADATLVPLLASLRTA
ncbi:MAG TPA: succinate dehydrogenase assembly factor 2 [Casimicrobiaceae bacterium]|nr:succinate dehydrogenase assembly factor 2 [Casimicrobiaceae bacterium]